MKDSLHGFAYEVEASSRVLHIDYINEYKIKFFHLLSDKASAFDIL